MCSSYKFHHEAEIKLKYEHLGYQFVLCCFYYTARKTGRWNEPNIHTNLSSSHLIKVFNYIFMFFLVVDTSEKLKTIEIINLST